MEVTLTGRLQTYERLNCSNSCHFLPLVNYLLLCQNQNRSRMIYHPFWAKRCLQNCLFVDAHIHRGIDRVGRSRLLQTSINVLCLSAQGYGFHHMKLRRPFCITGKPLLSGMVDKVLSQYSLEDLLCHPVPATHMLLHPKQRWFLLL